MKSHKQCSYCGKQFQGPNIGRRYASHLKLHQPKEIPTYNCKECKKIFIRESFLIKHVNSVHPLKKIDLNFDLEYEIPSAKNEVQQEVSKSQSRRKQKIETRKYY